jgi:protein-S-isoprenylcysteine O-methyltransferase Ste14
MSVNRIVEALLAAAQVPRSTRFKIASVALGTLTFVVLVPALIFVMAGLVDRQLIAPHAKTVEQGIALSSMASGLLLSLWTLVIQLTQGRGTPVPLAPPQKLIVSGPYRFCRNPLQLGITLYYLGVGTWFGSLSIGVLMFLFMTIVGACHHKVVEEKELRQRFGEEYETYRKNTPFLIPRIWD